MNLKLCLLTAEVTILKKIQAKVHWRSIFGGKCYFNRIFAILTPLNELEFAPGCFQSCNP